MVVLYFLRGWTKKEGDFTEVVDLVFTETVSVKNLNQAAKMYDCFINILLPTLDELVSKLVLIGFFGEKRETKEYLNIEIVVFFL